MFVCKVIGAVVASQNEEGLVGKKLLLCERQDGRTRSRLVAVDLVGAGPGTEVLVARRYGGSGEGCIDDEIVAIVDSITLQQ